MPKDDDSSRNGQDNGSSGEMTETLMGLVKDNKELLASAALSAAGAAAVSKGPELVRKLTHATEERGEDEAERLGQKAAEGAKDKLGGAGMVGKALSKVIGGGGGSDGKKTRRLPIQRWTDVAVPVDKAFKAWTKFDEFPKYMHRVLNVEQMRLDRISWQEKIWFSKRQWEGRITERRKNDRIVWKTTNGMSHKGVVSFHKLDDNLTRVMVTMEFEPNGMIEKMASGLRFVKRAVQADLARYKAYVEMEDAKGIEYHSESQQGGQEQKRDGGGDPHAGDEKRRQREQQREERRRAAA
jgi:uncharacterized membrane protein